MNLLACLTRPAAPPPARRARIPGDGLPAQDPADEPPRGCGWFDSSHELQQGLLVREHASAETLAGELPLAQWLDLHLQAWRPALPA